MAAVNEERRSGLRTLFRVRDLCLLLGSTAISATGDWLYGIALLVYLYDRTHSASWIAAANIVRFLPYVLFGTFGGLIVDRYDRRRLMIVIDAYAWRVNGRARGTCVAWRSASVRRGADGGRGDSQRAISAVRERCGPRGRLRRRSCGSQRSLRYRRERRLSAWTCARWTAVAARFAYGRVRRKCGVVLHLRLAPRTAAYTAARRFERARRRGRHRHRVAPRRRVPRNRIERHGGDARGPKRGVDVRVRA